MKHSLTVACTLASLVAVGSAIPAFSAQAEPPSAPVPAGTRAPAAPAGPSKVAVIGFQQAVIATNEGQTKFGAIRAKYAPKEAALKSEQDQINALKKTMQDKGSTLTDAERQSTLKTIDDKTKSLQREAEDAQNDMSSDYNDAFTALAQKVYVVLQSYAQQHGYTLVLDGTPEQNRQSPILWFNQGTNITQAVVEAYNAKSGVPAPSATAAPAAAPTTPHRATPRSTTRPPR